jgi:hypothetical protein
MRTLMLILAMLATLALTTTPAAAKLDCLTTQAQARKVYPAQALKYRQINDTRCWYAGRTRAKSEFRLPATLAVNIRASTSESRRGEPAPPHRTAYSATFDHDEILSMCGGPCPDFRSMDLHGGPLPQPMAFEERWHIATGERR